MAYLKHGDYNVILVDWSYISMKPYAWSRSRVPMVSKYISSMIDFLEEHGMDVSDLTVAGHSLGGQIAGLASHYAKHKAKLVINDLRVAERKFFLQVWIQPFRFSRKADRERGFPAGTQNSVMVIHTAVGLYGYDVPLGDIDFYPNGGTDQLGCTAATLGACSHYRAPHYFAESINSERGFWGVKCDNYEDYRAGERGCGMTIGIPETLIPRESLFCYGMFLSQTGMHLMPLKNAVSSFKASFYRPHRVKNEPL
ncbi:lipase member H-like [Hylaeus volcanicus]|uniref:lipase member H-like n=1 Tax=Hylaeus volcanicus TaxID=313075 RepID=UPI0023B833C5|nr:lipase member H-like [Hylaeus volcanicus]